MSSELFKILSLLIIVAVCSVLLKSYRPEYAMLVTLAAVAIVLVYLFGAVYPMLQSLKSLFEKSGLALEYFALALKALGISYISCFVADTCRDFGHSALAAKAELAGKCAVFVMSVPLICGVLETAVKFAGL